MSASNDSEPLPAAQKPLLYVARSAKHLTGIAHQTIVKYLTPDAWSVSMRGDKIWPMWEESRLLAWSAEWHGMAQDGTTGNLQAAPEACDER